jgi:hypothetical protein
MYDNIQIANEIQDTAQGISYYGNALRVAKDILGITMMEKSLLDSCLTNGCSGFEERMMLQDLAIRIRKMVF